MRIAVDMVRCCGCRTCELACSFHYRGVFAPEISSIKVWQDCLNGEIQAFIDATCDLCKGEARPLCVEFCMYGAMKEVA